MYQLLISSSYFVGKTNNECWRASLLRHTFSFLLGTYLKYKWDGDCLYKMVRYSFTLQAAINLFSKKVPPFCFYTSNT